VRSAILADAAAYSVALLFLLVASYSVNSAMRGSTPYRPTAAAKKRFRSYAIINHFSDMGSLLLCVQTDNFFIAALMNQVSVGAYAFYARLNEMTSNLIPIRVFENVVQPMLFAIPPEEAKERLPRYFSLLININLMFQLPLIAYTVVYHREIVQVIFGGKFIDVSGLLPLIVCLAFSENGISIPVTMIAQYTEKVSIILKSQLFGLYQVAAMLVLIPLFGLYGAAIATGTLHLLRNLYVWCHVRSYARWLNYREALTYALVIWATAIAFGFVVKNALHLSGIGALLSGIPICGLASLLYLRTPALSAMDRDVLGRVLHGREADALRWLGILRCKNGT
jgi:O-antigen/teichoic acid export membrane protein